MFKRHSMPPPSALPPLLSHSGIPAGHRQQTIETRAHLYLTARCPRPRRGPRRPPVHQPDVDRNTPNRADTPQLRRRWRLHGSVVVGARNKVLKSDGEPASARSSPVITVRPRTGRALAVGDCGWTFHGTADGAETTRSSASPATRPVAGSARAAQARLARLGAERGAHVIRAGDAHARPRRPHRPRARHRLAPSLGLRQLPGLVRRRQRKIDAKHRVNGIMHGLIAAAAANEGYSVSRSHRRFRRTRPRTRTIQTASWRRECGHLAEGVRRTWV